MKISPEQRKTFEEVVASDLYKRLASFLRERFEDTRAVADPELVQAIRGQVERAVRYGLQSEQQLAAYVTTAWLLGKDFDETFPRIRTVLCSPAYQPDEKSDFLLTHTAQIFEALGGAR
jgi:hypothetical protein